jgi:predicted ATPase/class 3 adenylate cyclase
MKNCPECGFQNPIDLHICLRCAAILLQICQACGAEVSPNNKFCGQCGAQVKDSSRPETPKSSSIQNRLNVQEQLLRNLRAMIPSSLVQKITQSYSNQLHGQRREVTILCVKIANLEEADDRIDSEGLFLAIDHIMQFLTRVVYKYEGTIDQFSGQGLTALFGIPLNHENDPERAVRTAFEMLHEINQSQADLNAQFNFTFQLSFGINTGSVIVGEMGSQQHVEYTVIGDTVNLANSLQDTADLGQILVSFNTYQRASHVFEFQSQQIKSSREKEALTVYQPMRLRYKLGQVRGLPGLRVPLVGRMDDINLMQSETDDAIANLQSHIILISGEAGLGKSRLVAEFINAQKESKVTSYWGTCAAYMRITPYRLIADVIRNILAVSELDPIDQQNEALQKFLTQIGLTQQDILPNLLHVLGLLHSDSVAEARLRLLEPLMLQRETQLALRTFFTAVSRRQFSIFIFDDLHWVDQASQQFLEYFCQVVEGNNAMLLILVSRDFESYEPARLIAKATRKHSPLPKHIELTPLSIQDSRLLIDQFIPEKTDHSAILKNLIIKRAAGNPFYTEEFVRILMDNGGLVYQDGIWQATPRAIELLDEVPGTLQDILLARFDRLPNHLRHTAQRASVLGDSFAVRLLSAIHIENKEELVVNLAELEARDFLLSTRLGNEEGYLFKHPLLQETIYKTLLRRDLSNLHFEIAQAIESGEHWLPAERNQVLAWHYSESHTPERAIPFLLASAEKATQHFANETVIHLYRQVLTLMESSLETYKHQIKQSKIHLGQALKFSGQFEEAAKIFQSLIDNELFELEKIPSKQTTPPTILIESLREVADLRTREGNLDEAVHLLMQGMQTLGNEARNSNPNAWRRLADRLAWVYFRQGKLEEAYNWADLALMDLRSWETDDPITLASLYNTIGGIYWSRSRFQDAITSVERSLAIYQDLGYQWGVSIALTNLGVLNYSIGKWPECIEYLERADQIRNDFGNHPERPINLINLGEALISMGDYDRAREKLNTSLEISKRLGSHIYWAYSELKLAHLSILENDSPQAHDHIDSARSFLEPLDEISERSVQYYLHLAQLSLLDEDLQSALMEAERALEIAEQGGFQEKNIEILQVIGHIHTQKANYELAEKFIQQSLNIKGSQFNEAVSLLELAYLYIQRALANPQESWAWHSQAENLLDRVIGTFTLLGASRHIQRAKSLHASLPARAGDGDPRSDGSPPDDELQYLTSIRKQLGIADGEWYQATILTLELVPNQQVDEEMWFETVAFLIPLLQEVIREHGGQILRHPNGITGIFGAPITHEDDPVRTVETAMQILNFHADLYQQTQLPASIRIGITMGRIVAGWQKTEKTTEFLASGKPLLFARALANSASPSQVWITQAVFNATSFRFQYNPVPIDMVASLDEKAIFQLEGEREQILPVRGLIGLKTVFVGRQPEINILVEASMNLYETNGKLVWMEGEPGIGKSRLTRELENQVTPKGIIVLRGICTARRTDIAFSVFSDLLTKALDIQPNFSPEKIYNQIDEHIAKWSLDPDLRPFLEILTGVQPTGSSGEQLMSLEPEQLRRQTFVSLNRLISRLAFSQPLIMILDDIQWIDAISADLLMYLSPLVLSNKVMIICVQRLNEASAFEQTLARVRNMMAQQLIQIKLKPLSKEECNALLDLFLGNARLEETLKLLIVQQSGGNPYYIEEFVRMLVEQDYLRVERGKLEVNQSFEVDKLRIPSSLETLIRSRVDALPPSSRQVLQVASVIGHRFSENLLAAVMEKNDIRNQLEILQNRGMLLYSNETSSWEFGHPMIEIIVYNTVLKAQRRILHDRTAQALESQWLGQESEHADELAYHFSRAENHGKTLDYLILAGERAATRYANDAATAHFEQAYDLLTAVSDATALQHWRIITGLGTVYQLTGKFDSSVAILRSGLDLLQSDQVTSERYASLYRILADTYFKKGDFDLAITNQLKALTFVNEVGNPTHEAEAARVYARLGWSYFRIANFEEAQSAVLKAEDLAAQTKNLAALAAAENLLGGINWSRGVTSQAMKHTQQAMLHFQELGYTWGEAIAINNLAILEANSGNWNAAANLFQRALNLRIEMGDVEGIALTYNNLAHLAYDQGKFADAEAAYRASLAVSEPLQINYHQAVSYTNLVKTLITLKHRKEAQRLLKIAIQLASELDAKEIQVELKGLEAKNYLEDGNLQLAEDTAHTAILSAVEIKNNTHESSARRLLSEILLCKGQPADAMRALDETWERLSESIDEIEIGRVHAQFARLWNALNEPGKLEYHFKFASDIFTRLGAAYDLEKLNEISANHQTE